MRLDKLLSNSTGISRTEIKKAIRKGEVTVDGTTVKDASIHISSEQHVSLFGQEVCEAKPRYYMLNKPEGYVCANKDREHPTVLDLMIGEPLYEKLNIAGRLDIDTTGLVLLTDDGKWLHNVTSPKHHCHKRYIVQTAERVENNDIEAFKNGIMLKDELKPTLPATLTRLEPTEGSVEANTEDSAENSVNVAEVVISEGRYHQVKRMFGATNNRVVALHRAAIGDIALDDNLAPGEYRPLTQTEIDSIQ